MLKSLLIGLDGSEESQAVLDLGLRWAQRFDALAVGIGCIDQPGILASSSVLLAQGASSTADLAAPILDESRRRVEKVLEQFVRRCGTVGVTCRTLEDFGTPYVRILIESQSFDIILLARNTHFDFEQRESTDETLTKVIRDSPRPVVVVPETLHAGESVVVAFDGSLQAARALASFEASGLGDSREVHVVSVAETHRDAVADVDRAVEFLRLHEINAICQPVETKGNTAEVILQKTAELKAGLLVIGAYGQPILRDFFLGSVTRTLIRKSQVPVFCFH